MDNPSKDDSLTQAVDDSLNLIMGTYPTLDRSFVRGCITIAALQYLFRKVCANAPQALEEKAQILPHVQAVQDGLVQPVETQGR